MHVEVTCDSEALINATRLTMSVEDGPPVPVWSGAEDSGGGVAAEIDFEICVPGVSPQIQIGIYVVAEAGELQGVCRIESISVTDNTFSVNRTNIEVTCEDNGAFGGGTTDPSVIYRTDSTTSTGNTTVPIVTGPIEENTLACEFNSLTFCAWNNEVQYPWTIVDPSSLWSINGISALDRGFVYKGLEGGENDEAILVSDEFFLLAPMEISFWYHISTGSVKWLEMLVSVNRQVPENLWFNSATTQGKWVQAFLHLCVPDQQPVIQLFIGAAVADLQAIVAIDGISVFEESKVRSWSRTLEGSTISCPTVDHSTTTW